MKCSLIAKNDKQLGVCLRVLCDEGINYNVDIIRDKKRKVNFEIHFKADLQTFEKLRDRYDLLIS